MIEARNDALLKAARARKVEAEQNSLRKRKTTRRSNTGIEVEQGNDRVPRELSREAFRMEEEECKKSGMGSGGRSRVRYPEDEELKEWGVMNMGRSLGRRCKGGDQWRRGIEVLVGNELWDTTGTGAVLAQVRSVYGDRVILMEDFGICNGIRWKSDVKEGDIDPGWGMVVMSGDAFVEYLERSLMREYVQWVMEKMGLVGKRLIIAGVGVDNVVKGRQKEVPNSTAVETVASNAVTDCCTMLMMEFGIRVALFTSEEEVAGYILQVTDCIDKECFYKGQSYFEATRESRRENPSLATAVENETRSLRVDEEGEFGSIYMKMLTEMAGVSTGEARGIRKKFPTLMALFREAEQCGGREDTIRILAEVTSSDDGSQVGLLSASVITNALLGEDGHKLVGPYVL